MSPAFVKEIDKIAPLGERPVSQHPNYVTPEGRAHIAGEVRRLSQDLAKAQPPVDRDAVASAGSDLRYWLQRLASAQTIAGLDDHAEVRLHRHFDHADGNAWLNSVGARIIAQANTRKHLSEVQRLEDRNYNFLPLPTGGIPSEVFSNEHGLKLNGSSIGLKYYDPAHTDSDISVTFGEADILRAADTYWNGIYPFIDYSTGGSIDGMIAASEASFAATTDKTIIIPGHGKPVSNRGELKDFRDMLVAIRENVAALKKQGRSRDETVAAKPTAAFDAKWGNFGDGHDMNHYADDLAALTAHLDLKNAIHVGHSTGGGEVTRYLVRHGESRVAKAVLISAVPLADGEDGDQSSRPSQGSVRRIAGAACGQSLAVLSRASGGAFYGYNRPSLISAWRYAALPIGPSNVRI